MYACECINVCMCMHVDTCFRVCAYVHMFVDQCVHVRASIVHPCEHVHPCMRMHVGAQKAEACVLEAFLYLTDCSLGGSPKSFSRSLLLAWS